MKDFRPAKKRVEVSVGEPVHNLRELQELSQSQLSGMTGLPRATNSAAANGRGNLAVTCKYFCQGTQVSSCRTCFPRLGSHS